jgi:transcriptional regulator with XRE-family HTH domain
MTSNEIFAKMLDWIFANTEAKHNADVAKKAKINATSVSRILNGQVKNASQDTLRAVNAAYGNVFNPEWIRGKSDIMLVADLHRQAAETNMPAQQSVPDMSSLINATIAAKDETIMSLKRELSAKEQVIAELRARLADKADIIAGMQQQIDGLNRQIADKADIIAGMQQQIDDKAELAKQKQSQINLLEQQLFELQSEKGITSGRKPTGVADSGITRPRP